MADRTREHCAVARELAAAHGATVTFEQGRKHIKARFTLRGRTALVVFSRSTSARNAEAQVRRQIGRTLRAMKAAGPPAPPFDQTTSWNTPGFVETFRVHKG
jgi:hypothetical protein